MSAVVDEGEWEKAVLVKGSECRALCAPVKGWEKGVDEKQERRACKMSDAAKLSFASLRESIVYVLLYILKFS